MDKLTKSPRLNKYLYSMGLFNYYDVINHLPRRYEDLSLSKKENFVDKGKVVTRGYIVSPILTKRTPKIKIVSFQLMDDSRHCYNIIAFNRDFLSKTLQINDYITIWGIFDHKLNQINMINYVKGFIKDNETLKPIYTLPQGFEQHNFISLVRRGLNDCSGKIYSKVPYYFQNKYRLISKEEALKKAHFPSCLEDVKQALRHLKYEEALLFSLKNKLIRENNKSMAKIKKEPIDLSLCEPFVSSLPFRLTEDQKNAANEIINDMNQSSLMYRLLQGDVGTGKTAVAFVAMYANFLRGDQSALMAPTDALAKQHYENAIKMFSGTKVKIALLVGSTPISEKHEIYDDLKEGFIDIVIGTHALFTKSVIYSSLGLIVIDEQHRFGVNQRLALLDKGEHADLLMMSATPIPRSLALTIFGDLDISTLYAYPNKERKVTTKIVNSNDKKIYELIDKSLNEDKRVYVVAPLIDYRDDGRYSVEQLFARFLVKYHEKVGLLHGNLKPEEKEESLKKFASGETPILVTTQVIEVGIDVKKANLMVIYDANNFGLASLHQLRGRIGRDGSESICLLTLDEDSMEEKDKLSILTETLDGFKIAEADMSYRGPGDLTGLRQSGIPDFCFLNVVNDYKIFVTARDDAKYIFENKDKKEFGYIIEFANREILKNLIIKA